MLNYRRPFLTLLTGAMLVLGVVKTSAASSLTTAGIPSSKYEDASAVAASLNLGEAFWSNAGTHNNLAGLFINAASDAPTLRILPAFSALNHSAVLIVVLDRGNGIGWILHFANKPVLPPGIAKKLLFDSDSSKVDSIEEASTIPQAGIQLLATAQSTDTETTPTSTSVPEPSSLMELCTVLLITAAFWSRRRRKNTLQRIPSSSI